MTAQKNPFSDPKSNDRDALAELADHPGFRLFEIRVLRELDNSVRVLRMADGLQNVGRAQGEVAIWTDILKLRNQMIDEINEELAADQVETARQRAEHAFWPPTKEQ